MYENGCTYPRNGWLNGDLSASRLKSDGRWRTETLAFRVELGTELRVSPFLISLSLSFTFSLLSAFISFVVSIFVLYSQVNGTNERHSATLTRFDHPPKLFSYERFVNRSNSLIPIGCLNHINDIE